jgi:predicted Co/Zn/Cd cation transporter (cation efflux family)
VLLRLTTLAIAQAFDFATFSVMVNMYGVSAEANPLVQRMFLSLGTPAVVMSKVALVVLIVALVIAAAVQGGKGRWKVVGGMPLALGIAAGLIGGITNAAVLLP